MAAEIILKGRVQGVGCRYYTGRVASALKIYGSATNLSDGTVRVLLDVDNIAKVKKFIEALRKDCFNFHFWGNFSEISFKGFTEEEINGDYIWR